jgi:hypothetical protein
MPGKDHILIEPVYYFAYARSRPRFTCIRCPLKCGVAMAKNDQDLKFCFRNAVIGPRRNGS